MAAVIRSMENKTGLSNPGAFLPVRGSVVDISVVPVPG
jgi:hypothetical protein